MEQAWSGNESGCGVETQPLTGALIGTFFLVLRLLGAFRSKQTLSPPSLGFFSIVVMVGAWLFYTYWLLAKVRKYYTQPLTNAVCEEEAGMYYMWMQIDITFNLFLYVKQHEVNKMPGAQGFLDRPKLPLAFLIFDVLSIIVIDAMTYYPDFMDPPYLFRREALSFDL